MFVRDRYGIGERRRYRNEPSGYGADNWHLLAELGVLGLPFAASDGGLGGGPRELITVMEALGSGFAVEPILEEIVVSGGILARIASHAQKDLWLGRLIRGEAHIALAHFEHAARFNLSGVGVSARSRNGAVLLDGDKSVVPLAAAADRWIVSAREDYSSVNPSLIGFYLVDPDAAGIERRDFRLADGSIASSVRFREVTAEGRLHGNYEEFEAVIDDARLAAGAEMVGIMSTLFRMTAEYLKNRKQFGQPLATFQTLQHRMADLYVLLEQSRSHLYRAAAYIGMGAHGRRGVAGMKSYISRAAIEMGEECVHLHGGIGMTDELMLGHGYKRLVLLASLFGDSDSELVRFNQISA